MADRRPEWLVEEGIAEQRAIRVDDEGAILAARLDWPGTLAAGTVADATLTERTTGSKRGIVRFAGGEEATVDNLPRDASEGAPLRVAVTRPAMAETGRLKRARARVTTASPHPAPSLADQLRAAGEAARVVRRFPADCDSWDDLLAEAWEASIDFSGGSLVICPTPAMTLIDVDGHLRPAALALAAANAAATAILRFDMAGSIGIDFPTLSDKAERKAVDDALGAILADWPHERTAINGFGFVQIVARLERPSLIHRIVHDRPGAAARLLLRRAEAVSQPGALLLTAHPAVLRAIRPEWEAELARRTGRLVRRHEDPALALAAGFAQSVPL